MAGGYAYRPVGNDVWPAVFRGVRRSVDARRQATTNAGFTVDPTSGAITVTSFSGAGVNIRLYDGTLVQGGMFIEDFSGQIAPASLVVQGF